MTILLDRPAVSRLAKALRRTAGLPSHSSAMEAVARALGFRDANPMAAALRDGGAVTLRVPSLQDSLTVELLREKPSIGVVAEHLRRMLLATRLMPTSPISEAGTADERSNAMLGVVSGLLGAAKGWFGSVLLLEDHVLLDFDMLNNAPTVDSDSLMLTVMAERAGVTPRALGEAFAEEMKTAMDLDVDIESEGQKAEFLIAFRAAQDYQEYCGDSIGTWSEAVPRLLRTAIGSVLVNEHPMFRQTLPCAVDINGEVVALVLHAVRGGISEPFRYHAVREGEEIPEMHDSGRNVSSPFRFFEVKDTEAVFGAKP